MILDDINTKALSPALALLPMKLDSVDARVLLLAIGQQESRFIYRRQQGNGPARGFWQNEQGGGVKGVLGNHSTVALALALCDSRKVAPNPSSVWAALEFDDVLAAGFARLILFADPKSLPAATDSEGGWDCYLRNWRPGKPKPDTWAAFHKSARQTLGIL